MSVNLRRHVHRPYSGSLDLPPPFRPLALREAGDAFRHACVHASELGAGALVHVGRFDVAEFAVVLEPSERLASARLAFYAGMLALVDALAAMAAPETPIAIGWPDVVYVDGGLVGGGRLAWPHDADEHSIPAWLVFGAVIRIVSIAGEEAGLHPTTTALAEEGFGEPSSDRLLEGFARHLMVVLDRWQEFGSATIIRSYMLKLQRERAVHYSINAYGDFLSRRAGEPVRRQALAPMLAVPSWLDETTGGVRL